MHKLSSLVINQYKNIAKEVRKEILKMIYSTKSPHLGPSFSIVEILVALYFRCLKISPQNCRDKNRDRFILSKGHGCPALYAVLCQRGFFTEKTLKGFAIDNGTLEQHPSRNILKGIEVSTGSLGHGLSIGAGMAIAAKFDKAKYRIFVLLSDGELNEGSTWEAAMFAAHRGLDNLIAIVDYNKMQATGKTEEIVSLEPLTDKWCAFGWEIKEIEGHNFVQIINALEDIPFKMNKPSVVIAHTVKGKGVSFMQDSLLWHYRCPDKEEYQKALKELL
jgi:transketolase